MASSKKTAPTDEELLAQFDELGTETKPKQQPPKANAAKAAKKAAPSSQEEEDLLAELDNLAQERPKSISRPHTPRASGTVPSSAIPAAAARNSGDMGRTSEEKASAPAATVVAAARKSAESARGYLQSFAPGESAAAPAVGGSETEQVTPQQQTQTQAQASAAPGGSWWGGFVATATAAVTQAQAIAKDLQNNEEAQKWADQVKGNVGVLRSYGE